MRKKEMLSGWLERTGVLNAALAVRPQASQKLHVLAYHRVLEIEDEDHFPCDPELISASPAEFARQMEFVKHHFHPLGLSELLDIVERKQKLPPNSLLITFDDGHQDNYTQAYPILRGLGLPAAIFLSTGYIGGTGQFWFDRVATLAYYAPPGTLDAPGLDAPGLDAPLPLGDVASRRKAADEILRQAKRLPNARRLALLQALERQLAAHVPRNAALPSAALSWDQVREMSAGGIEFGSHCVTHPIMSALDDETLHFELAHSRATIQAETGQRAEVIAYPVGREYAFDQRVAPLARDCGYRLGFSYVAGVNLLGAMDPFAIKRIEVERYIPFHFFVARLAMPGLFL
jgi:peptidoglycan/xylan/chitin deacetylase (PgdA/CDA1 family)